MLLVLIISGFGLGVCMFVFRRLFLGCLWFSIRDGGTNVCRFRVVWLSGVVAFFRSAMGVAILFLFRCGVAVLD